MHASAAEAVIQQRTMGRQGQRRFGDSAITAHVGRNTGGGRGSERLAGIDAVAVPKMFRTATSAAARRRCVVRLALPGPDKPPEAWFSSTIVLCSRLFPETSRPGLSQPHVISLHVSCLYQEHQKCKADLASSNLTVCCLSAIKDCLQPCLPAAVEAKTSLFPAFALAISARQAYLGHSCM